MLRGVLQGGRRLRTRRPPWASELSARSLPRTITARAFAIAGSGKSEEKEKDLSPVPKQALEELTPKLDDEAKKVMEDLPKAPMNEGTIQAETMETASAASAAMTNETAGQAMEAVVKLLSEDLANRKKEKEEKEKKEKEEKEKEEKKEKEEREKEDKKKWWFFDPITAEAYLRFSVMGIVGAVLIVTQVCSSSLLFQTCTIPAIAQKHLDAYVERDGLEERIRGHVQKDDVTSYLVVVGPRGGGKSTAIKKVLARRRKVVYVELNQETPTIHAALRQRTLWLSLLFNYKYALAAYQLYPGDEKPVFVVEIATTASEDTIRTQAQELKELCTAVKAAHGILVLSDANAAGKLNQDPGRQKFLWVDVFSEDELQRLFDNLGVLVTDGDAEAAALRREIIDDIGPTPQDIVNTAGDATEAKREAEEATRSSGATEAECMAAGRAAERKVFEQWCEQKQKMAGNEIDHLLTQSRHKVGFRRLVPVLVENYPVGVDTGGYLSAKAASTDIKEYHAISYNVEAKVYQFYSAAHYHAAYRWLKAARRWFW